MNVPRAILAGSLGLTLVGTAAVFAQRAPADNVNARNHPNIAAAQDLATRAYNRIKDAQKANEYDLGGHAHKAELLLDQANQELRLAASASNADHR